jgi:tRNA(Ser,Leu) C12 N-acetylase TAN1
VKQKTHNIYNKILKMTHETLRMQMLAGVITEGEYKAKLQENKKKKPLKESNKLIPFEIFVK